MSIKLVVFDMAGTAVSDENYVGAAFTQAMKKYGYAPQIEEVNPIMGYEKPVAIRMMLEKLESDTAKITDELIASIHDEFVKVMLDFYRTSEDIYPLPNVEETFKKLKAQGIKIGLDTGFSRDIADLILERLDWHDQIDCMVASDEVSHGRPYPYMIQKMMEELQITNSNQVAKVGDTEVDINEGHNAGCKYVIGITTGSFTRQELEPYKPTHIIDDMAEIFQIINA